MKNMMSKIQNAILVAIALAMGAVVALFILAMLGGALIVGLIAVPLGLLAALVLGKPEETEVYEGETQTAAI